VTVTFKGGEAESVGAGDLFYWPPGHTVRVDEDAELILFSPQHEHGRVLDHLREKLSGANG
jgi:quercetin dioxygenase-like cupin family protein